MNRLRIVLDPSAEIGLGLFDGDNLARASVALAAPVMKPDAISVDFLDTVMGHGQLHDQSPSPRREARSQPTGRRPSRPA